LLRVLTIKNHGAKVYKKFGSRNRRVTNLQQEYTKNIEI